MLTLFIAEDSLPVRKALKAWLAEIPWVRVVGCAGEARKVSALIENRQPDVVFLDNSLAGGSGIEVLKRIKTVLPPTVVVMFTADDFPQIRSRCQAAGADYFLNKSTEFAKIPELLQQIRQIKET